MFFNTFTETCAPQQVNVLTEFIVLNVILLSQQKYSSNVVEKCLSQASKQVKQNALALICTRPSQWVLFNFWHRRFVFITFSLPFSLPFSYYQINYLIINSKFMSHVINLRFVSFFQMVKAFFPWFVCKLRRTKIDRSRIWRTNLYITSKIGTILQWNATSCLWS